MKNIAKVKEAREHARMGRPLKGADAKSAQMTVWTTPAKKDAFAKVCAENGVSVSSRLSEYISKDLGWKE